MKVILNQLDGKLILQLCFGQHEPLVVKADVIAIWALHQTLNQVKDRG